MSVCTYCHTSFKGQSLFCCRSCELLSSWISEGRSPLSKSSDNDCQLKVSEHWSKYQTPSLEKTFDISLSSKCKKFRFYIEGLQCASCVHLLEDLPQFYPGIRYAQINYGERTMVVEAELEQSLARIGQAIENLGYKPTPLSEPQEYLKALKSENRNSLKRIGVAGAVAGNLMLFSVPIYAGLSGSLGKVFLWLSSILFLPLLFYSADAFYKKAWSGILSRQANVDMMIVVALWSGFLLSIYNLTQNIDDVYFDSTASFIFLILLTRYLLRKYYDKIPTQDLFKDLFLHQVYQVKDDQGQSFLLRYDQLTPGQEIHLKKNQIIPCDAVLKSSHGAFDFSFLTGEPHPQVRHQGDILLAGSQVLEVGLVIRACGLSLESDLSKSLKHINPQKSIKDKTQTLTDLAAHHLTLYVFGIAGLFFILSYSSLGIEAFKRCLALITIACPCAIAFGTPLAQSLGLKKASQKGFFIKSSAIFERISQIKKVIFDKTGTLTSSQLNLLKTFPEELSYLDKSIILGMEKLSQHPVAVSLRKNWPHIEPLKMDQVEEIIGSGVTAMIDGEKYQFIKSTPSHEDEILQVEYIVNGDHRAYLYFQEQIRAESSRVVLELQKKDFEVLMLTGDQRFRGIEVAKRVGIRPSNVFSDQTAESKKTFITEHNPCLYIGDGLNDLPALNQAYVSFALRGVFESAFKVSDVYAPQKGLDAILEIIQLSSQVQSVLKYNLLFALFYNTLGGILALLGFINPLVAALLMPLSSFIILIHTYRRLK